MNAVTNKISTEYAPLTKDQVKAMRSADVVAIFHNPFGSEEKDQENAGMIRVTKKVKTPDGWQADRDHEVSMEIPVWSVTRYYSANNDGANRKTHPSAFEMTCGYMEVIKTLSHFIKVGDVIELNWDFDVYGPDSELRRHGMTMDRLQVLVRRDRAIFTFAIAANAGPINSSARLASKRLWGQ